MFMRLLSAGICFHSYQQLSYMILSRVAPVTHSIGNCEAGVVKGLWIGVCGLGVCGLGFGMRARGLGVGGKGGGGGGGLCWCGWDGRLREGGAWRLACAFCLNRIFCNN